MIREEGMVENNQFGSSDMISKNKNQTNILYFGFYVASICDTTADEWRTSGENKKTNLHSVDLWTGVSLAARSRCMCISRGVAMNYKYSVLLWLLTILSDYGNNRGSRGNLSWY